MNSKSSSNESGKEIDVRDEVNYPEGIEECIELRSFVYSQSCVQE